jgi:hypothetical protein
LGVGACARLNAPHSVTAHRASFGEMRCAAIVMRLLIGRAETAFADGGEGITPTM